VRAHQVPEQQAAKNARESCQILSSQSRPAYQATAIIDVRSYRQQPPLCCSLELLPPPPLSCATPAARVLRPHMQLQRRLAAPRAPATHPGRCARWQFGLLICASAAPWTSCRNPRGGSAPQPQLA
jgi:hypothetical protein